MTPIASFDERSYQETIDYLYGLQKHGIKLGLSNSFALMKRMGDPHRAFRTVHIAGTNGKGSTAAALAAVLQAAGYRTGLYTSPHLVSFSERIRVNDQRITEERVVELAARVRSAALRHDPAGQEPLNPTFFEVTTTMAFTYFAEERVDIAVVETGMGGRLDSTNVLTPIVSVITNIDLEHREFLGDTIDKIAGEKAGIIKQGVPVVTGATQPEALAVIEEKAAASSSALYLHDHHFRAKNIRKDGNDQIFDYEGIGITLETLRIPLQGRYQIKNACLALAAAECLGASGFAVGEAPIRAGLAGIRWEGRLERVAERPDIYLDGAHNPAAARVLAGEVRALKTRYRGLHLVIGILADKDWQGIAGELTPLAESVIVTRPAYERAMNAGLLSREIAQSHKRVSSTDSVQAALDAARSAAGQDDMILVTGSLYVVGDARAVLMPAGSPAPALKELKG